MLLHAELEGPLPPCTTALRICSAADSPMLQAMATALHPDHGTVIMNMHGGGLPAQNALMAVFSRLLSAEDTKGYHPSTEQGLAVQQVGHAIR